MQQFCKGILICSTVVFVTACNKDDDPLPVIPPSEGATLQLNGGAGGSSAVNTVYVDFSAATQDSVKRSSWDLAFSTGSDYRVLLNHTVAALANSTGKSNMAEVSAADTVGMVLTLNHAAPSADEFSMLDDIDGDLSKSVIAAIAANEADNKVYIINRGTGGGVESRDWLKIKINRKSNGYVVQYAKIAETSFSTVEVTKDSKYHFNFVSFDKGVVMAQPEKENWDIQWGYSIFKTNFGTDVPYGFSDLIAINYLSGVEVAEVMTADISYDAFGASDVTGLDFSDDRWAIGSSWRATTGASVGVRTDRFYVVKDTRGNLYKLKFISFTTQDGGTRGKPEISFQLIKEA